MSKPFLYLSKNNFSVIEIDSTKLKIYAFIPFTSYAQGEIGLLFIREVI